MKQLLWELCCQVACVCVLNDRKMCNAKARQRRMCLETHCEKTNSNNTNKKASTNRSKHGYKPLKYFILQAFIRPIQLRGSSCKHSEPRQGITMGSRWDHGRTTARSRWNHAGVTVGSRWNHGRAITVKDGEAR